MKDKARILGIDPGSRITGFGVIEQLGFNVGYVSCGVIKTTPDFTLADRLKELYDGICEVIETYQPNYAAIENVFVAKNPNSALKLGQARGVLMLAARQYQIDLYEYAAKAVKQAVVGYGQADKHQIQQAVRAILKLSATPSQDAADALSVAMCCSNHLAVSQAS